MSRRRTRVPPAVPAGGRIAIVAPGSSLRRSVVRAGLRVLRAWGFEPVPAPHLFDRAGDLAGADDARAADLAWAFEDPAIDAVWAARGGWGTPRLLGRLDLDRIARRPRWLLGFSDVTALQAALLDRGVASLHAPLVADLANPRRFVERDLRADLADPLRPRRFTGRTLVPGRGAGRLAGGCLTLLAALAGTPWQPDFRGAVVFVEEIAEAPYRVDRLLWQIRAAGMFDGIAGLAFGQFVACRPAPGRPSRTLRAVLAAHAADIGVPAMTGIPAGHGSRAQALPLGFAAGIDAGAGTLRVEPPR